MLGQAFKLAHVMLKYGLPVLLALTPALAIYGFVGMATPSIVTESFPDRQPVLVGLAKSCSNERCQSRSSYALAPSALIVTVTTRSNGSVVMHEEPHGLLTIIASYLLCIAGTWWLWRGKRTPPNNSSKSKPLRDST